ncbi:MAG: hypothetical protein C4338_03975 [Rhodanobacteraceae bacterium]
MGNGLQWGMNAEKAMKVFANFDTNQDGFVDKSEFMVNGGSGQRFPAATDANVDGKLSRTEFINCAQAQQPQQ